MFILIKLTHLIVTYVISHTAVLVVGFNLVDKKKSLTYDYNCGISPDGHSNRIVAGTEAAFGAWPWVASLRQKISNSQSYHFCDGSVIGPRFILTAAHCFHNVTIPTDPNYVRRTGEVHIGQFGVSEQSQRVAEWIKVIIPEEYRPFRPHDYAYDIALLVLDQDIVDSRSPAICLPTSEQLTMNVVGNVGDQATVLGWGILNGSRMEFAEHVTQVNVSILDPTMDRCNPSKNYPMTICAEILTGNIDACQGNSGGPLAQLIMGRWYNIGIVSHGHGCGREKSPGFYTRVNAHLDWLCQMAEIEGETLPPCPVVTSHPITDLEDILVSLKQSTNNNQSIEIPVIIIGSIAIVLIATILAIITVCLFQNRSNHRSFAEPIESIYNSA